MNRISLMLAVVILASTVGASLTTAASSKSDLAKEKRWKDQIVDSLVVGDEVMLAADGINFLALYAEPTTEKSKGVVILLHGIGVHPAWPDVIEPLRTGLPELGWHTLSLQMPVLKNAAEASEYNDLIPEVSARLSSALDFLRQKNIENIIVTGHSMGSLMAAYYIAEHPNKNIKSLVILGGDNGVPEQSYMDSLKYFKQLEQVNIIDVYGSDDTQSVLDTVSIRRLLGKRLYQKHYQLVEVEGANHFYRGKENKLIDLLNWRLTELAEQAN
ncbi:MAG: alpha/beta hydrolase family protein [Gammaproteobacteria bacterium]|nr:alpha/beta hydrolase family protein [Gammaproteobacteria bacterium]